MARFRRILRRRKPVRRVRRLFRRRVRRKARSGNLHVKFCKSTTIHPAANTVNVWASNFILNDFPEYVALAKNFESTTVKRIAVRIVPMQNVSNNSTSRIPAYCMLPWHYPGPAPKDFNTYLSSDRVKIFRGTQTGRQTYVPSTIEMTQNLDPTTGAPVPIPGDIKWRPTIRWNKDARIYGGLIAFQGDPTLTAKDQGHYNIFITVYCKMNNQTTINV